jgi:L-asparaginase
MLQNFLKLNRYNKICNSKNHQIKKSAVNKMQKRSILVIYTGGTIGMIQDPQTGALSPFDFSHLYNHIPILKNFDYKIDSYSFDPLIDSSNVNPEFWVSLATVIEEKYEEYDGFVVLHGTDTMSYTASMLSFMLENLNKPVVFTGSQLPMGVIRTDGRDNFINAIEIAASYHENTPVIPEVSICFDSKLFRGNRTTKYNADNFKAFISANYPLLAEVGVNIRFHHKEINHPNFKKLKTYKKLDTNVALLKLYPGISENFVESVLSTKGLKALVLETYGAGNASTDEWFINSIEKAISKGIIIFNVTQCKGGSVDLGKYETSYHLSRIGVISGHDITTESAITKLMFLIGSDYSKYDIERCLQTSIRGEITVQSFIM